MKFLSYQLLNRIKSKLRYLRYLRKGGVLTVPVFQLPNNHELDGKTCVITGGARGLGKALTERMLNAGAEVIVIGSNQNYLDAVQKEYVYRSLQVYKWDMTDISHIDECLTEIIFLSNNKRVDIWINNAAYVVEHKIMRESPMLTFDKTFALNVKSLLFVGQAVCDYFKKQSIAGKMINISSLNSVQADLHPYYISKHAVNAITEALAKEYIPYGININGVAPGYLPSGINNVDIEQNGYRDQSLAKRYVRLEEIAELVLFLISGRANSIVGQTIFCDGGDTLR